MIVVIGGGADIHHLPPSSTGSHYFVVALRIFPFTRRGCLLTQKEAAMKTDCEEKLLNSREVAEALSALGYKIKGSTLAQYRFYGGGPPVEFYWSGKKIPLYRLSKAIPWAKSRCIKPAEPVAA
jgi:hypothetical protein